jgi:CRP-like cAMP-binding protein
MLHGIENGAVCEIAVVGNEGVLGMAMFMSEKTSCALVKSSGNAYRIGQVALKEEFERGGELHDLLLRYTQALVSQIVQTAVCNKHHSVDQQFCRTLLMSLDRLGSDELVMTQEWIAETLSVRRQGVSTAASELQTAGIISYVRGRIVLLNRTKLEARVCECYRMVKKEYGRLFDENGPSSRGRIGCGSAARE